MFRLLIALLILAFTLKSDASDKVRCDWTGIEIDSEGCVNLGYYQFAIDQKCENMPDCFKLETEEGTQIVDLCRDDEEKANELFEMAVSKWVPKSKSIIK